MKRNFLLPAFSLCFPQLDPVNQYREFKQATIAALTPNSSLPVEDKRAAITRALEERTR
jgi:hypothetical protein